VRKDFFATKVKSMLIIAPEKHLIKKIEDALNLIKKVDPDEYKNSFFRIDVIFVTNINGAGGGIFPTKKSWLTTKSAMNRHDLNWLASLIIHEACHSAQFKDGKLILSWQKEKEREREAVESQIKFLRKLGDDWRANWLQQYFDGECKREDPWWVRGSKDRVQNTYFRNLLKLLAENKLKLTFI